MAAELNFIDEMSRSGMLHLEILRAAIPRGSVESLTVEKLPEECFLIREEDIPGRREIELFGESMPLLSEKEIRYEGQPLLVIAAPDRNSLSECRRRIQVSYTTDYSILAFDPYSEEQVADTVLFEKGNVFQSTDSPHQIIEAEYYTIPESHITRAPLGALAYHDDDRLVIQTPTHWLHHVGATVAAALGISGKKIRVLQCASSPAYGEKILYPSQLAVFAALALRISKRPARIILSPFETADYTTSKAPMRMKRTSTLDPAGSVHSEKVEILFDIGAYPLFTRELLTRAAVGAAGYYPIPNLRIEAKAVITSSPPKNIYRELGLSQSLFATETHFSRLAELAQHNPGEWKRAYADIKELPTGAQPKDIPLEKILGEVMERSDFHRKHAAYEQIKKRRSSTKASRRYLRGIGISSGFTGNGFSHNFRNKGSWNVIMRLDKQDKVTIYCGDITTPETIQGIWRRRTQEILGTPIENVEVIKGDSDTLPDSGPLMLSTAISVYTNLIERCCREIKKQRFDRPLPITVKRGTAKIGKGSWDEKHFRGNPFHNYSWGAVVVEIELDALTLIPVIRGIWAVFDAGIVYNNEYAVSLAENSIYEALSWAMGEQKLTPRYYQEYSLEAEEIISLRLPPVDVVFIDKEKGTPGGITPLAEALVPSAFISALCQATGAYFDVLPITPELIQSYLEEQ
jgi:CO/xanthine dehydrogenase Mo-binding subunit